MDHPEPMNFDFILLFKNYGMNNLFPTLKGVPVCNCTVDEIAIQMSYGILHFLEFVSALWFHLVVNLLEH